MRTIRVTGKGQLRVKPDQTRITLSLEGLYPQLPLACNSNGPHRNLFVWLMVIV